MPEIHSESGCPRGGVLGGEREAMQQRTAWCPINALEVAEVHLPPSLSLISTPMEVVQAAG